MEGENISVKINPLYNKIKESKIFNIKFYNHNINNFNNFKNYQNKNFRDKFIFKIKEKNSFQNKTQYSDLLKPDNNILVNNKNAINFKNNIKENKESKINFENFNFNKIKRIRCCSQEQRNKKLISISQNENINNIEEGDKFSDIKDINLFFDEINKEFGDIGKLIKINLILDEKNTKYEFIKNEFILLKIIENELKEKYGIIIKEFIYKDKKLNVYKSLKHNNLEDNCTIKIIT